MLKIFPRHFIFALHRLDLELNATDATKWIKGQGVELETKIRFESLMPCSDSS